ncbi:putative F-box protein At3g29830 [Humulus lupulus]|uniref:putative F-box protein At3g29830 n=1 Tax=Humulus lupulus TaxID=3486 RepID=UPI002B40F3B4|nr:putative F-box protein At3g29830 [Humulus lupulus]
MLPLKKRSLLKGKRATMDDYHDHDDRISKLPDDILVLIINCLSLRDAARTSVLSRRWKNQWTLISGTMEFDASTTMEDMRWLRKERSFERPRYANWVNRVMARHMSSKLDELKICFDLDNSFSIDINNWVGFAAVKEVKKLNLGFPGRWGGMLRNPYCLSISTLSNRMGQKLNSEAFSSLTDLNLSFVNVNDEVVEYFLAKSPNLVNLCIKGSNSLVKVKVSESDPVLNLKSLKILECPLIKLINISTPKLVSFGYDGPLIDMPFKKVPHLSEVYFGGNNTISLANQSKELFGYFSMLKILKLDMSSSVYNFNRVARAFETQVPALSNLEQLELSIMAYCDQCILWPCLMIKAAPLLHRFSMKMMFKCTDQDLYDRNDQLLSNEDQIRKLREAVLFTHESVKEVELYGFSDHRNIHMAELWLRLVDIAVSLEKVTIDVRHPCLKESPWLNVKTQELDKARDRIRLFVQKHLHRPKPIDILVL